MTIVKRSLHPYNHTRLDQTLFLLETSWDLLRSRPRTRYVDYPPVLLCAPTGFPVELLLFLSLTLTQSLSYRTPPHSRSFASAATLLSHDTT